MFTSWPEAGVQRVGARELKQHTGAIIERVVRGERLVVTHHGTPVALLVPVEQAALHALLDQEAERAESLGWLRASEGAFAFWDNPEDTVWDEIDPRHLR